jgi:flagellar hook protein FlgE
VASTENSHLAIQGEGFFVLVDPASVSTTVGGVNLTSTSRVFVTRDGEFRTNQFGYLVNNSGYYLTTASISSGGALTEGNMRLVHNNLDVPTGNSTATDAVRLSDFLTNNFTSTSFAGDGTTVLVGMSTANSFAKVTLGRQSLSYTQFGSTVFSFGYVYSSASTGKTDPSITMQQATTSDATVLVKSLESSNASMTQSVPELSLAQKLFSALTKVFQTKTTNVDGVINLIR